MHLRKTKGPPKLRNVAIAFDHLSTTAVSLGASPGSAFSTAAADAKAESKWPGQFGKPGDDKQSGAMWPGQPAGKGDKGDKAAKSDKAPAPFQIVHFEAERVRSVRAAIDTIARSSECLDGVSSPDCFVLSTPVAVAIEGGAGMPHAL